MPLNEDEVEAEIKRKNLTAPRITRKQVDDMMARADYYRFPDTTLTICALKLTNGFCVTGESAAASPENFDEELGKRIALENARNKIWALEGYRLRSELHAASLAKHD